MDEEGEEAERQWLPTAERAPERALKMDDVSVDEQAVVDTYLEGSEVFIFLYFYFIFWKCESELIRGPGRRESLAFQHKQRGCGGQVES